MMSPIRDVLHRVRRRLDRETLGRIVQTAVAAGVAWELALQIPNHGRPFFAPIAAVIGLAADRGRRGRQAIQMIVGVALGIVLGGAVVAVVGVGGWQLVVASVVTLVVATGAGAPPVIRTQATASAILVVALHVPGGNLALQRLVDALIGGGLAILVARFLFPVEPLDLVRREAAALRSALAAALDAAASAIAARDRARAESALVRLDELDDRRLEDALALARDVVRKAPRRRPLRRRLGALGTAWRELELSVADGRTIGTGAVRLVSRPEPPPPSAAEAVRAAADAVRALEPAQARERAEAARSAARRLLAEDASLGASVLAHGVAAVADHALRAADARDEDRRLREAAPSRRARLPRPRPSRSPR
jgi:hypothetical protein